MTGLGNEGSVKYGSSAKVAPPVSCVPPHPMRRSTRIRWQIPILLTSLDPKIAFHQRCESLIVNLHGCALKTSVRLPTGTPVQLEVGGNVITGSTVEVVAIAEHKSSWMIGIALDQPGNFWGIENPPKDWDTLDHPAPGQASPEPSNEQSEPSSGVEKLLIWPSALGPTAQSAVTLSSPGPQAASPDKLEKTLGATGALDRIGYGHTQPEASPAVAPGLAHLQAELEQRAAEEWVRLRKQAEQHLKESGLQLRSELEQGLIAWREERAGVEGKIQELLRVREQLEVRLNDIIDVLRGEVVPLRDTLIDEARQEVNALIGNFQSSAAADCAVREEMRSAASVQLEEMKNACARLVSQMDQRIDEDRASREELRAQAAQIMQGRAEADSLLRQHRAEHEQAQQAIRDQVDRARQARDFVESQVHSLPDTITKHIQDRAQAMLEDARASLGQDVSDQVLSSIDALEKRLQEKAGDGSQDHGQQLSQELERQEKHFLDATAARLTELRELETSLRDSANESAAGIAVESERAVEQLRQQLQNVVEEQQERVHKSSEAILAALQTESANLLTSMRHDLQSSLAREQGQAIQLVHAKTGELLRDAQQIAVGALQEQSNRVLDSLRQELLHTFEERQQSFETAQTAAIAQLQQLEKRTDELTAIVDVELQAHTEEAIHEAIEQIAQQLQQATASVCDAHLATAETELDRRLGLLLRQAGEAGAELRLTLESLQQHKQSGEATSAQLQQQLQEAQISKQALDSLRQELLHTFEERQQSFETAQTAAIAQLQQIEKRTGELTAIVDVELQAHTEKTVHEAVEQITQQLQQATASVREAHLATAETELDRRLGLLLRQAGEAGAELRLTLESLQQHKQSGEATSAQLQEKLQESQTWVAREMEQFQGTIHDAFLKAAGEIRGRIQQGVEMAKEPIECRSREIQAEIAAVARQQVEQSDRQLEVARQRLQSTYEQSQSAAESALQTQVTEALDSLRQQAEQLGQRSIGRWQSALTETLAAIPQLLAAKIAAANSTGSKDCAQDSVAEDRPGE